MPNKPMNADKGLDILGFLTDLREAAGRGLNSLVSFPTVDLSL